MQPSHLEHTFHAGENVDVLDSVNKWMNAEVMFVCPASIYIHYTGWSIKYDEEVPLNSARVLKQWQPGHHVHLNNRVDAYHPRGGWLQARVIEIGQQQQNGGIRSHPVKVHFFNYHKKYDIWVNLLNNNQVAIIGSRSKAYGMGKNRRKQPKTSKLSEIALKLLSERLKKLQQGLDERGLVIKKSGGDGNCLFRSISDQLYGDQKYHEEMRKICLDYIALQKDFFTDYVVEDIDRYIDIKRRDGEWGDDVEIQALSEIYARPIEIYVFGDKPIRTFHEQNQKKVEPIRLAYIAECHYDSIKPKEKQDAALMQAQFGEFEKIFFSVYKSDMGNIVRNRNIFSVATRLQDTIGEHFEAEERDQNKIQDELNIALQLSEREALLEQIQNAELKQFQNKYQLQKMEEDIKIIEQKQLQEAKKLSQGNAKTEQHQPEKTKPYWFEDLQAQGFSEKEIWFAIQVKGYDPDAVQNFLLDNICI